MTGYHGMRGGTTVSSVADYEPGRVPALMDRAVIDSDTVFYLLAFPLVKGPVRQELRFDLDRCLLGGLGRFRRVRAGVRARLHRRTRRLAGAEAKTG